MKTYHFEMTDTFGSDLNYCWLRRFTIKAKNKRGALIKLSRETGFNFKNNGSYYKAKNACIGAYEYDDGMGMPDIDWIEKSEKL